MATTLFGQSQTAPSSRLRLASVHVGLREDERLIVGTDRLRKQPASMTQMIYKRGHTSFIYLWRAATLEKTRGALIFLKISRSWNQRKPIEDFCRPLCEIFSGGENSDAFHNEVVPPSLKEIFNIRNVRRVLLSLCIIVDVGLCSPQILITV